jgi:hypothetical protein
MTRPLIIATTTAKILFLSAAFGQELREGTASIPDFSGIWAHPSGQSSFEPLSSGPRPVTGLFRRSGVSDPYQYVGDYTNPILKPEAAQAVKKARRNRDQRPSSPHSKQPLLAVGGTLHFFPTWRADITAAGQDHFPLPPRS